jgi:hypothetical protein
LDTLVFWVAGVGVGIDRNLKGHVFVFFGAIASQGWLSVVPVQFVTFACVKKIPQHPCL